MTDYQSKSLLIHEQLRGKIAITGKLPIDSTDDLSIAYTPGVAAPCEEIAKNPLRASELTIKKNTVAVVSDGSAVLGLGNIGPLAAIPVMEGKCLLFKHYSDIDAFPICLDTQDTEEIIETVRRIAPVFGGINLEDISAPRCFEIEERLQDLGIPVFHDDQHGTAIVLLAAIINSAKLTNRDITASKIVINGAGAAGSAICLLINQFVTQHLKSDHLPNIIVCDRKGAINKERDDLNDEKKKLLEYSNPNNQAGSLQDCLVGADVFIGVSSGNILNADDVKTMAKDSLIFPMANPTPEIFPEEAIKGGAAIVGTGRSDFPNQVNNVLAFPGIFRGALDSGASHINTDMKIEAALALAGAVTPTREKIIPSPLDKTVAHLVAKAICKCVKNSPCSRATYGDMNI